MTKPLPAAALAVLLTIGAAACGGGDDGGRPSKADLSKTIQSSTQLPEAQSDCIADKLLDSKLSDKVLQGVAKDDESGLSEAEKDAATSEIAKDADACGAGG